MSNANLASREWLVASRPSTSHLPLTTYQKFKFGFGIMEVLAAAVVLGFLIVGLNILQKGNREGILRVRQRDAANFVAQYVLDSLSSLNINTLVARGNNGNTVLDTDFVYHFEGKPQLDKNIKATSFEIKYDVTVELLGGEAIEKQNMDTTRFTINNRTQANTPEPEEKNEYAKSLEATVSWDYKKSRQSIKMAKVVR